MPISHAAHKVHEIRCRIVITIKHRQKKLLLEDKISLLKYVLSKIEKRSDIRSDMVGTDSNHSHLFVDVALKYSPSEIFRIVKSITAREFFVKFPEIKRDLWEESFGMTGYTRTVGEGRTDDIVRKYIPRQGSKEDKEDYRQFKLFPVH